MGPPPELIALADVQWRDHRHREGEELHGRLRLGSSVLSVGGYHYTPPGGINDAEADEDVIVLQTQPAPAAFI